MTKTLSIIVPIYNERHCLAAFFRALEAAPLGAIPHIGAVEIIIIDDGSTDGSNQIIQAQIGKKPTVGDKPTTWQLLSLPQNLGKGSAVRAGLVITKGDLVLIQDADLEYDPQDYPKLLAPLVEDIADVVYGSRFIGYPRRVLYFWHALFNRLVNFISNLLNDLTLTDLTTCYKAMSGPLARSLSLKSQRFGIEAELATRFAAAKARIYEVPVSYKGRTYDDGKKFGKIDGLAMFWHVLRFGIFDREPFKPGLMQTLTALDTLADKIYRPVLHRALSQISNLGAPKILEVGSGLGAITRSLLRSGTVVASDIEPNYVKQLTSRFSHFSDFKAICWDITQAPPERGPFDLVVMFNVLEHIERDEDALQTLRSIMTPQAHIIILVPNSPLLFNNLDRSVGHHRRYTKKSLIKTLEGAGFETTQSFYANSLAMPGWLLRGAIGRNQDIPASQIRFYVLAKYLLKPIELLLDKLTGLSVVAIARPSEHATQEIRSAA